MPQNDQIWPKIGIFGQFGPGHAGLFNALLWDGWWLWRAGCISQDTYLLYIFNIICILELSNCQSNSGTEHKILLRSGQRIRVRLVERHCTELGWLGFHKGGGGPLLALPQAVRGGYCPQKLLHLASQRRQGAGKMDFKKERMKETKLSKFFVCSLLT